MYSNIADNKRKTVFIMLAFVAFTAGVIWLLAQYFGGSTGVFYGGMVGALIYTVFTYYAGSKMALAMNGAKQIQQSDNPRLWRTVENLSIASGMPMPKVYIIDDPGMNAFATGRDPKHAVVAATSGILDALDDDELEGVMAHELGHVKNYDIRVSMVAFALTAVISLIADIILRLTWFSNNDNRSGNGLTLAAGLVAAILAPLVATMIQLAISRQREYLADATGALTTRYPEALASALEKISTGSSTLRRQNTATAHLFFANPLKGGSLAALFSTHPPIADRISRLRSMGTHA
jgi:heat shock protein HtpX